MHHAGRKREWRNQVLRDRDVYDYRFVDWLYGPTALTPGAEPPMLAEFDSVGAPTPQLGGVGMLR
jgi:salicylate hydroxylase